MESKETGLIPIMKNYSFYKPIKVKKWTITLLYKLFLNPFIMLKTHGININTNLKFHLEIIFYHSFQDE